MMAGIVAAHETTAHGAANAVKLLLERRERWEELVTNPALIPNAVEECLRHSGSVAAWRRIATKDTEVGGVQIKEGEKLLIVQASANRDPEHFEDAEVFDPRREEAVEHLTFGYGAHQCLGKNLARMEIQVFLHELTTRLPHLRLALPMAPNATVFREMRARALQTQETLIAQLNETIRKHDYRFRHEPAGDEKGSPERAVAHVAGDVGAVGTA